MVALAAPGSPRVGCQNQYVGLLSLLPSGPSWMVMLCSSVRWKYFPMPLVACAWQREVSVELGGGPLLVYSVLPFFAAHTSPR